MKKKLLWLLVRFLTSNAAGALLYLILLFGLAQLMWYVWASVIARVANTAMNFFLQKYWAFQNKLEDNIREEMALYAIVSVGLLGVNTGGLYALVEYCGLPLLWAQAALVVPQTMLSFCLTRWVFRR